MTRSRIRPTAAQVLSEKRGLVSAVIHGKESASSTSLSRSYDLPIDQVQALMRVNGVRDDG